jgi:hypothetical protein
MRTPDEESARAWSAAGVLSLIGWAFRFGGARQATVDMRREVVLRLEAIDDRITELKGELRRISRRQLRYERRIERLEASVAVLEE